MKTTTRTLLATAASVGLVATGASAQAAPAESSRVLAEHVTVRVMLDGAMTGVQGNQHRFTYQTDTEGMPWPASAMKITSFFCPTGATVTQTWRSSRCTHRSTSYLRPRSADYRVSSTMRSAVVDGTLVSGSRRFAADLTLFADGAQRTSSHGGAVRREVDANVSGTVGGARVRWSTRGEAWIHRYETVR